MKLRSIEFDDEGVAFIVIEIKDCEELVYAADTMGPDGMVFPIQLSLDPASIEMIFDKAMGTPGMHPDADVANRFSNALAPVVDRLIRHESPW